MKSGGLVRGIWLIVCLCLVPSVVAGQRGGGATTLVARRLLDVDRGAIVHDAAVVIENGRIVAAGPRSATAVRGAVTDLGDVTLLPGLIDAHVHLTLGGAPEANARVTLLAGFTTVQDLGALEYSNVRLRDSIASGRIPGPRVVTAGPWLGRDGLTCDFNGIGVRGATAFRERVRRDVREGVDLIKVCASGWLAQAANDATAYEISDDELAGAIEEAHLAKRRVAVHAISVKAISAAVSHGADSLVHGGFTGTGTVAEMKARNVRQLTTLWSFRQAAPPTLFDQLRRHMSELMRNDLPIAFGTDAGVVPHGRNALEFPELEAIGLSRLESIRAATLYAAKAVGLPGEVGTLRTGSSADLIAVNGNPLDDLRMLQEVRFVMKQGVVARQLQTP